MSDNSTIINSDKEMEKIINDEKKITMPFLSKYEKARVIGLRTQQLASGSKPLINTKGLNSNLEIAEEELKQKKIPFIIKRRLPNNKFEHWNINSLIQL